MFQVSHLGSIKNTHPDSFQKATTTVTASSEAFCAVAAAVVVHAALHVTRWPNHHNRASGHHGKNAGLIKGLFTTNWRVFEVLDMIVTGIMGI